MSRNLARRLAGEGLGSFLLFVAVIGSGIMAERLSAGNTGVALLANSVATGAMLFVLIAMIGPLSGAHFNPAVSLAMCWRGAIPRRDCALYIGAQIVFGILGAWVAHAMFDLPVLQLSIKARTGSGQWLGEGLATFGLLLTIIGTARHRPSAIPASVALYIVSAYWFTSSTSFANPAITIARSLTDTFAGIAPGAVPGFIVAQLAGAALAVALGDWLFGPEGSA